MTRKELVVAALEHKETDIIPYLPKSQFESSVNL